MEINGDEARQRCALIVGHPGHELRVLGWMRKVQPIVAVLTDGSGHTGKPRTDLSSEVFHAAGATHSLLYGIATDRKFYRAILEQDHGFFLGISETLTGMLIDNRIECVAGDAIEGYNPTHDLCRLLIDRAVRIASVQAGCDIGNYAFPLIGHPAPVNAPPGSLNIVLDSAGLALKLAEIHRYVNTVGGMLESEALATFAQYGEAVCRREVLLPSPTSSSLACFENEKPFYEIHGEKQVAAGHYQTVIRYRKHIAPIARILSD